VEHDLPPASQIAQERVDPSAGGIRFAIGVTVLGLAAFGVAAFLGLYPRPQSPLSAELAAALAPAGLLNTFGLTWARLVSAASFGIVVGATAVAARRLLHSEALGFLAGALVLLDPGTLALGRLALPNALAMAGLVSALALFLSPAGWAHWAGSVALGLAVAVDPTSLIWGVPLAFLILIRGHIYAAPQHLGLAAQQALALPALGAGLHLLATDGAIRGVVCQPGSGHLALLTTMDFGGVFGLHNPFTWFGGVAAILYLGADSLATVARQFRLARLPGRLQMRLGTPLQPTQARILWILFLAVLVPFPALLMPVLAIALAAGIGTLAEDAPGFGAAVALAILLFAVLALGRAWDLVAGTASPAETAELLGLVPWTSAVNCTA
jgi:hypothetical protein